MKKLHKEYSDSVELLFEERESIHVWAENIMKMEKLGGHQSSNSFNFYCGNKDENHFYFTVVNVFWVPSQLLVKNGTDYLPDGFLPITMEIGSGSNSDYFLAGNKNHMFIGIYKDGSLWRSKHAGTFKTEMMKTSIEEINGLLRGSVLDDDNWRLISQ